MACRETQRKHSPCDGAPALPWPKKPAILALSRTGLLVSAFVCYSLTTDATTWHVVHRLCAGVLRVLAGNLLLHSLQPLHCAS